jgi:N-acetylmuramoyl-L-alanine amidase
MLRCWSKLSLIGLFGLLAWGLLAAPASAKPAVIDAKLGVDAEFTRVVLDLTEATQFRVFTLSNPDRVVVDLDELEWLIPQGRKLQGRGLVAAMRYGLFKVGTSRIVLDLAQPVQVVQVVLVEKNADSPMRLVIDLQPAEAAEFLANEKKTLFASAGVLAAAPETSAPAPAPDTEGLKIEASLIPQPKPGTGAARKPLIVIDPGHGGIDPGATGGGTEEKDITLAVAKALQAELAATGRYRVMLTREHDVFVPLRERFQTAREHGADLFVSLHADAHANGKMRGASVYTLSETASDKEAEALAAKENKSDVIAGMDLSNESEIVSGILIDLAQRETINLSARFAKILVKALKGDTLMLGKSHRYAGFAVLKAPDIPSVLLEMGYVSSAADKKLLISQKHQHRLAKAITRAIREYLEWHEMVRRS